MAEKVESFSAAHLVVSTTQQTAVEKRKQSNNGLHLRIQIPRPQAAKKVWPEEDRRRFRTKRK